MKVILVNLKDDKQVITLASGLSKVGAQALMQAVRGAKWDKARPDVYTFGSLALTIEEEKS